VQAALDTPDVAQKSRVFSMLAANLPEDVLKATLGKLGEKGPSMMVSAGAGAMLREAPDVAQSILRGQEAIKAEKGFLPEKKEMQSYTDALNKKLTPDIFSLAGRTDE